MKTTIGVKPSTLDLFREWKKIVSELNPDLRVTSDYLLKPLIQEGLSQAKLEQKRRN